MTHTGPQRGIYGWRVDDETAEAEHQPGQRRPFSKLAAAWVYAEHDRWFLWSPVLLAAGVFAYFRLAAEPPFFAAAAPILAALLVLFVTPPRVWRPLVVILCLFSSGIMAAKLRTLLVSAPTLHRTLPSASVEGFVELVEPRAEGGTRVTLWVTAIEGLAPTEAPRRVRLRLLAAGEDLKPADAVRVAAHLAPPAIPALPGGYDFARSAFFQQLGAVGFTYRAPERITTTVQLPWHFGFRLAMQRVRQAIGERIRAALPGETGAIANALMTGERGGVSEATNNAYRDSGIFHILSISGLHMAIMGGAVFFTVRLLLAAIPAVALRYPIKKWAAVGAIAASFAYLLISGGAFATIRSFIMIAIMFLAIMFDRPALALRNVALAALLILFVMPESLFDLGFQMSFAAVTALIAGYEWISARRDRARVAAGEHGGGWLAGGGIAAFAAGIIASTVLAGIAVAPLSAFHFHATQSYAALTNLIAVPISNFIVMPAALAAFIAMPFGLEAWPLVVMGWGIDLMTWAARKVAALPGAVVAIPAFSETALGLMLGGGLWLALWRRRWRLAGLPAICAGLYLAAVSGRPDMFVGRDGALVAVRGADGRLSALPAPRTRFELQRWLEFDGDRRAPELAASRAAFRCDLMGCTARLGRHLVAVPRSPAALADDCRRADLIVLSFPKPSGCRTAARVFDFYDLRNDGAHALTLLPDGGLRVETVAGRRGDRPWTVRRQQRQGANPAQRAGGGAGGHAPVEPGRSSPRRDESTWRPEIEDGHPLYW